MSKQLYFEDVKEGTEIPTIIKNPTTMQLVKFAGASEDFNPIHYDKDKALADGLPGVIAHGRLKNAFLIQVLTDWIGDEGWLKKIAIQHRGMDQPRFLASSKEDALSSLHTPRRSVSVSRISFSSSTIRTFYPGITLAGTIVSSPFHHE